MKESEKRMPDRTRSLVTSLSVSEFEFTDMEFVVDEVFTATEEIRLDHFSLPGRVEVSVSLRCHRYADITTILTRTSHRDDPIRLSFISGVVVNCFLSSWRTEDSWDYQGDVLLNLTGYLSSRDPIIPSVASRVQSPTLEEEFFRRTHEVI